MKFAKLSVVALFSSLLVACANDAEQAKWRPFKDINGEIKEMSFITLTSQQIDKSQQSQSVERYFANLAMSFGEKKTFRRLGEMFPLGRASENYSMATIFLLNDKSLNIYQDENVQALAKAKEFEFYEFGAMRLSHAKFTAKTEICKDFRAKNGVNLLMTTNYYPQNSFTDFYTALIEVNLQSKQAPQEMGYHADFTGNDTKLQAEIKQVEQERGKDIAVANVKEKASLLFNIICKQGA
ncbi:hypothetical protein O1Q79_01371 [Lonepinella sp. MS14434]|uniref:hypothetical protein n=1 Tax=unclassified Lonepinella TaxID=2642006 RepID=UPI0036DDB3D3